MAMTSREIRQKFLEFFKSKGHTIVPSSSLVPTDDSVLLTTAGMQQFKPYYTREKNAMEDFGSLNTASVQKCARTSDIEEVGDETHLTFFEMLGNFSFGGYFKKEAITYAYEFITKEMGLKIDFVSVFARDDDIPADEESEKIWREIDGGIEIKRFGREDNFWGPTGEEGPCGPTTEIYVGGVEIWNLVFNEYFCGKDGKFVKLETPGVDTGMGLERLVVAVQKVPSVFETDLFKDLIFKINTFIASSSSIPGNIVWSPEKIRRSERIIADHIRAVVFMISDGIVPDKQGRGYVTRRIIRRSMMYMDKLGINPVNLYDLAKIVIGQYGEFYPNIKENERFVLDELGKEGEQFTKVVVKGFKKLEELLNGGVVSGKDAFVLYSTYGLPIEMIQEYSKEKSLIVDLEGFHKELKKHQELSKTASAGMFKGGLADSGEEAAKLHTATHLLQAALREVLGEHIVQKGSNVTAERLRFDFSHPEKLTDEQKQKVEEIVNEKIKENLPVVCEEMSVEEAKGEGAIGVFNAKYGDKVKVYSMGLFAQGETPFSREICGGPHAKTTGELGRFRIKKEEASSAGVRRIKAVLE